MRIGIVCPYSFDVPGGVQFHVRDLAEHLIAAGHEISVMAPADEGALVPEYLVSSGKAMPVRYNGSVARLTFGPRTAGRVSRWLENGRVDVIHIHEPIAPSVSILALMAAQGPITATFHTSFVRSRAMQAAYPLVRTSLEKIHGRIAVSEAARQTLITHVGGDAVVIPNGVYVDRFATAAPEPAWQGRPGAPSVAFLGRIDEPRKGLPVLLAALPGVLARIPGLRVYVAGYGDVDAAIERTDPGLRQAVSYLGSVSDDAKARLLASVDAYVAPHTGGESFGIVLVEAMSAGTAVLASDLAAFMRVLDDGRAGATFRNEDPADLSRQLTALLTDDPRRRQVARAGQVAARRYDWSTVAEAILTVYETVVEAEAAGQAYALQGSGGWAAPGSRPLTRLLRRRDRDPATDGDPAAYHPRRVGPQPTVYLED